MQATEYDVETERRGMKYHTLDSVQTMIGKRCGKPWRAGQRSERLRRRDEQTRFQTPVHSGGLH